jgi:hypothetical protein
MFECTIKRAILLRVAKRTRAGGLPSLTNNIADHAAEIGIKILKSNIGAVIDGKADEFVIECALDRDSNCDWIRDKHAKIALNSYIAGYLSGFDSAESDRGGQ